MVGTFAFIAGYAISDYLKDEEKEDKQIIIPYHKGVDLEFNLDSPES